MSNVIELKPPTDAKLAQRGRITRQNLEALHAKADARRSEALAKRAVAPLQNRIFVKPASPQRAVLDLAGSPYPAAGLYVQAGDVYVHRRLRDGSLLRANPPETGEPNG